MMGYGISIAVSLNQASTKRILPPAGTATAELTLDDVPVENDTVTVGNKTYTFTPTGAGTDEIALLTHGDPADLGLMFTRVGDKINNDTADTLCTAEMSSPPTILLSANTPGAAGNSIPLSATGTWATITPFSGGSD